MPRLYVIPPGLLSVSTYPALKRWARLFRASGAGFTRLRRWIHPPELNLLAAFNLLHGELLTLVRGFDFLSVFDTEAATATRYFPGT
jgi:hypothetical protein